MKYVIFSRNLNMNLIELPGMITYSKTMYTVYEWVYCFNKNLLSNVSKPVTNRHCQKICFLLQG